MISDDIELTTNLGVIISHDEMREHTPLYKNSRFDEHVALLTVVDTSDPLTLEQKWLEISVPDKHNAVVLDMPPKNLLAVESGRRVSYIPDFIPIILRDNVVYAVHFASVAVPVTPPRIPGFRHSKRDIVVAKSLYTPAIDSIS
ncbi:hypothetical protein ON010_g18015 [Phytophthora cinnamomi]|nr:hypothetical protein ON010_g18015 [Phytophthora cinnamomi]